MDRWSALGLRMRNQLPVGWVQNLAAGAIHLLTTSGEMFGERASFLLALCSLAASLAASDGKRGTCKRRCRHTDVLCMRRNIRCRPRIIRYRNHA